MFALIQCLCSTVCATVGVWQSLGAGCLKGKRYHAVWWLPATWRRRQPLFMCHEQDDCIFPSSHYHRGRYKYGIMLSRHRRAPCIRLVFWYCSSTASWPSRLPFRALMLALVFTPYLICMLCSGFQLSDPATVAATIPSICFFLRVPQILHASVAELVRSTSLNKLQHPVCNLACVCNLHVYINLTPKWRANHICWQHTHQKRPESQLNERNKERKIADGRRLHLFVHWVSKVECTLNALNCPSTKKESQQGL